MAVRVCFDLGTARVKSLGRLKKERKKKEEQEDDECGFSPLPGSSLQQCVRAIFVLLYSWGNAREQILVSLNEYNLSPGEISPFER